ncbi:MAG: tRNA ((37)-N6)-threonylcarbamoyltransferase complex dimerization subunit type 1 TsaB [Pseudomonadota bacterium]|jgi:tRNA threonylcarbamoyladenosine biosynthesis protein TsaB
MTKRLLALDTATEACSAALLEDGTVIRECGELAPRRHNLLLLGMIDSLLAEAAWQRTQLDGIAFGRGPGSFTGVRIATSVAKGLAMGLDCPLAGISTLEAMGLQMLEKYGACQWVMPCIDARMDEVYVAAYARPAVGQQGALLQCLLAEAVIPPQDIHMASQPEGHWGGCGSGWERYAEGLSTALQQTPHVVEVMYPWAATLGRLASARNVWMPAEDVHPVYLRDRVVQKPDAMR